MEEHIDTTYLKGFNAAYLMAQHETKLFELLIQKKNEGLFFEGMQDGREQYYREQAHKRIHELNKLKDKGRNLDLER